MSDELKLKIIQELAKNGLKIKNFVMEMTGDINNYEHASKEEKTKVTDEQIARAIISITGEKKPLNEKQLFLGVICVLLSKYGWSGKWATCCTKINSLPMNEMFEKKCDYNSIKVLTAYKFASVDYKDWEDYEPSDFERAIFKKCKSVADAFDEAINMQDKD